MTREHTPMRDRARSLMPRQYGAREVTRAETPIRIKAWVTPASNVQVGDIEVEGIALAWTPRAVQVEYLDKNERVDVVWVWANAVTRLPSTISST